MNTFHDLLTEATGITDTKELDEIEEIMRCDIFHSTLDWQTRDEIIEAAKVAAVLRAQLG